MRTIADYYQAIDEIAPFSIVGDWDNVGLLVGDKNAPVGKVLLALDATKAVIEEAAALGAELIISHHPLMFRPIQQLSSESLVYTLAREGIGLIAAHTNWDMAEGGVSETLAHAIGVTPMEKIGPSETFPEDFFYGGVGTLKHPLSGTEFALQIKKKLSAPGIRYVDREGLIQRVAYCGGSGGAVFHAALEAGADAFVTGELDHHFLLEAVEANMALFLGGHFHTETLGMMSLQKKLKEKLPDAVLLLSQKATDGIAFV